MSILKQKWLDIFAGSLSGIQMLIWGITWSSLVYHVAYQGKYEAAGANLVLLGAAVLMFIMAFKSSEPTVIISPHSTPAIFSAIVISSMIIEMEARHLAVDPFPTLVVGVGITSILIGLTMMLAGIFRLGNLVRYIPYPVLGGFFVGTAWLLFRNAFDYLVNLPLTMVNLPLILSSHYLGRWVPALAYALLIKIIIQFYRRAFIFPIMLLLGLLLFYQVCLITGISLKEALSRGLLIGPFPKVSIIDTFHHFTVSQVQWSLVFKNMIQFVLAALIMLLEMLPRLSGIELITKREMNEKNELIWLGIGNIVIGSWGGIAGFHGVSYTIINTAMGAASRLTGVVAGLICFLALLLGTDVIGLMPRFLLGVLIFYVVISYWKEWLIDLRKNISLLDYTVILIIPVVMAQIGLLPGVAVGIAISFIIFIVQYSSVITIRRALTGEGLVSHVYRNKNDTDLLNRHNHKIYAVFIHGALFFGNCSGLYKSIVKYLAQDDGKLTEYLVIDFKLVTNVDISAIMSFMKIVLLAKKKGITILFTNLTDTVLNKFQRTFALNNLATDYKVFATFTHGLEWCEDQFIDRYGVVSPQADIHFYLQQLIPNLEVSHSLLCHMVRDRIKKGTLIYSKGDIANELFIIESGLVDIVSDHWEASLNLRAMQAGTVVGEMGFYSNAVRSANVIAKTDVVIYRLSKTNFEQIRTQNIKLAEAITAAIASLLAERLEHANAALIMSN